MAVRAAARQRWLDGFVIVARDAILWHPPPAFGRLVLYIALVVSTAAVISPASFSAPGHALPDDHAAISLDLAIVRAYCGRPSSFSSAGRIAPRFRDAGLDRHLPIRTVIATEAGSVDAFCASANVPFVNNENSLMLLEAGVLSVFADLSFAELGEWLHRIRITAAIVSIGVLLSIGASLAFAFGTMCAALIVSGAMPGFVYSAYPFLWLLVLVLAATYGLLLHIGATESVWASMPGGAVAGLITAFTINLRTSYLPITVAALAIFVICAVSRARQRSIPLAAFVVSCGVSVLAFNVWFIHSLAADGGTVSHSIMHPLVLSLAVPPTAFSKNHNLAWDDAIGPRKAAAIDPEAGYLGPRYSAALFTYYRSLWASYPLEMARLYFHKFNVFGPDMLLALRSSPGGVGRGIGVLLAPLSWIPGGVWLLVLYLAIATVSLAAMLRTASPTWLILGILTAAACLAHIEAGIIYSLFVQQYHNYAAFFAMLVSLAGLQAVAQLAARKLGYGTGVV